MPTLALLNGHAFAGGFMLGMYHDYRIQNADRGFLCLNELEFGVPLQAPMVSVFREKLAPTVFRDLVLEAKRFGGAEALKTGVVDGLGGLDEALAFTKQRGLTKKAESGVYAALREEMYRESVGIVNDHQGNLRWRETVEEITGAEREDAKKAVEAWEKRQGSKL